MKVRHKSTGIVTEVLGMVPAHEYEIVRDPNVPVTEWEDVTEACKWTDHLYEQTVGKRTMGDIGPISILCSWENGYRLVKEQFNDKVYGKKWAFRVERRKP